MNRFLHIFLLLVIAGNSLNGQRIAPTPEDLYLDAVEFMYSGDYSDALGILLNLYDRGYTTANISYLTGECYLNIRGVKTKAIPFLRDAVKNVSGNYTGKTLQEETAPFKSLLYLGIACRLNYDFEKALNYFNEYLRSCDEADKESARLAEYHIERCNYAREMMTSPAKYTADTLSGGINSVFSNFNPLVSPDERSMVYMDQLKFYDAVMSVQKVDSQWSAPYNLTPELKSDGDHYATGISANGAELWLSSYDPYRSGEIYRSEWSGGKWNEMKKLGDPVNTIFNETHASISPDGSMLYFVSDRKGGYGGTDIYRSSKTQNGNWAKAVNLGPLINSPYNEESPFMSSDGTHLYFSSQGHYNMGGYDVFCSAKDENGNWLPPVNIGYPLNTTDDDLFFFPVKDGHIAYQSRYGKNSPKSEIVRFVISSFGNPARFMINGKIDLSADEGFDPGRISVAFIDRSHQDTLDVKPLTQDGSFRQKLPAGSYQLVFSESTNQLLSRTMEIPDYFPHQNLVFHEELIVPSAIPAAHKDTIFLKNILFGFNTSDPLAEYENEIALLIHLINKYPEVSLKIDGYTDAVGSERFNLKLSLKRAESVKVTLESRIGKTLRIETRAYGESNPVAVNFNKDGTDNPEGRRFNRRVEVMCEGLPESITILKINEVPHDIRHK